MDKSTYTQQILHKMPYTLCYCLCRELRDCASVLDLGCGKSCMIQFCSVPYSVGIKLFEPYLQASKKKGIHNEYIKANITEVEFKENAFDAVMALEVLEHLTKNDGYNLLKKMEKWAKKKVIITTPNGYLYQDGYDDNPLQIHRSGWDIEDFKKLGYKVRGNSGIKILRGYTGRIMFNPQIFWRIVSYMTQIVTCHYPRSAFSLLCIKEVK